MSYKWTQEETQAVLDYYNSKGAEWVHSYIHKKYGSTRSLVAVYQKAFKLGLAAEVDGNWYTVAEIASMLNVGFRTVQHHVEKVEHRKVNRITQISEAGFEQLKQWFAQKPGEDSEWMPAIEAARMIGIAKNSMYRVLDDNNIDNIRVGYRRYVKRSQVEAVAKDMLERGLIKGQWLKVGKAA